MIPNLRRASALTLLALAIAGCGGGGGSDGDSNGGGGGGGGTPSFTGRYLAAYSGDAAILGDTQLTADMTVSGDGSVVGKLLSRTDSTTRATFVGTLSSSGDLDATFTDRVLPPGGSFRATGRFSQASSGFVDGTFQSPRGQFTLGNVTPYSPN